MYRTVVVILLSLMGCIAPAFAAEPPLKSLTNGSSASGAPVLSDDSMLIAEVYLNDLTSGESIEIYQHEGGFLVPLGLLAQMVEFPIEVDTDEQQARGWFIAENRIFLLDIPKGEVVIEGIKKALPQRLITVGQGDIYVDSSLFSQWFPIDLELDFSRLVLTLKPREKLPMMLRKERESLHGRLDGRTDKTKHYDVVKDDYQPYSIPFTDVDLNYDHDNKSAQSDQLSYSLLSQGDMGYLTSSLSLSGQTDHTLSSARFKAGRSDYEGKLLGGHATEFYMGDIEAAAAPLASTRSQGRGVIVTNRELERADQFDSTNFIGDSLPGWDIELYRNGSLVDFQTVGENGRYAFNNVGIFYGNNVFRIVSYGPQGQIKEETKTLVIDSSILEKGAFRYQASVDDKAHSLFGIDEDSNDASTGNGLRMVGNTEYGLTDHMTGTFGLVRTPLEDGKFHDYQTAGVRNSFGSVLTALNFAYDDTTGGIASNLTAHTAIKGINIRGEQSLFNNFDSEEETATDGNRRLSRSALDIDGMAHVLVSSGISYGFGGKYETFEGNRSISTLQNRLGASIFGINLGNTIRLQETQDNDGDHSHNTDGDFSIRGRYQGVVLRFSTQYDIEPEASLHSFTLSAQKQLQNDVNINAELQQDLDAEKLTSLNTSLNKQFDTFRASLSGSVSDNGEFSVGTRVSFSFGQEPRSKHWVASGKSLAGDGAASARAYLDRNYNGSFDEGDEELPDIAFRQGGTAFSGDGKSPVLITGLDANLPTDVEVDTGSIDDPYWIPAKEGVNVVSRPGHVTNVDFAILITAEIDGTVNFEKNGDIRGAPRVTMQLMNAKDEIVATTKTEFDGYYIFTQVIPGAYYIRVAPEDLARVKSDPVRSEPLDITIDSEALNGMDLNIIYGSSEMCFPEAPQAATPQPSESSTPSPLPEATPENPDTQSQDSPATPLPTAEQPVFTPKARDVITTPEVPASTDAPATAPTTPLQPQSLFTKPSNIILAAPSLPPAPVAQVRKPEYIPPASQDAMSVVWFAREE